MLLATRLADVDFTLFAFVLAAAVVLAIFIAKHLP